MRAIILLFLALLASGCATTPQSAIVTPKIQQSLLSRSANTPWRAFGLCNPLSDNDNYLTEQINVTISGHPIYFPAASYSDLYNLTKDSAKIFPKPSFWILELHGADGERGYNVLYFFDNKQLKKRVLTTLFETQTLIFHSEER